MRTALRFLETLGSRQVRILHMSNIFKYHDSSSCVTGLNSRRRRRRSWRSQMDLKVRVELSYSQLEHHT